MSNRPARVELEARRASKCWESTLARAACSQPDAPLKASRWVYRDRLRPAQGPTGLHTGPLAVNGELAYPLVIPGDRSKTRCRGTHRGPEGPTRVSEGVTRVSFWHDTLKSGPLQPIGQRVSRGSRRCRKCRRVSKPPTVSVGPYPTCRRAAICANGADARRVCLEGGRGTH